VRGKPVGGNRLSSEFILTGDAAADALAVIHESGLETDERIRSKPSLRALIGGGAVQVRLTAGTSCWSTDHSMRDRVRKTMEETSATHET